MALTPAMEICAVIGAFIGCMIGTLGPYYKEKKRLGLDDVTIFFDKKFLKATLVAGILSAVTIGGVFPVILENVNPMWSYMSTIVFSAVLAMTLNLGGNIILSPSMITEAAKKKVLEQQTSEIIDNQLNEASFRIQEDLKLKQAETESLKNKQQLIEKTENRIDEPIETTQVKKVEFSDDGVSTL